METQKVKSSNKKPYKNKNETTDIFAKTEMRWKKRREGMKMIEEEEKEDRKWRRMRK